MNLTNEQLIAFIKSSLKPVIAKIKEIETGVNNLEIPNRHTIDHDLTICKNQVNQVKQNVTDLLNDNDRKNQSKINKLFDLIESEIVKGLSNSTLLIQEYNKAVTYTPGQMVKFNGGVFQAIKDISESPVCSTGWKIIINGIHKIDFDNDLLLIEYSDGTKTKSDSLQGPTGPGFVFKGLYITDHQYSKGDIVTTDGAAWFSKTDNNDSQPPGDNWGVFVKRGPKGSPGKNGVTPSNKEILNLINDTLCHSENARGLIQNAIKSQLKDFTRPDIAPEVEKAVNSHLGAFTEIVKQEIANQPKTGGLRYAGLWKNETTYTPGDMVKHAKALYICRKKTKGVIPGSIGANDSWLFVIQESKGGSRLTGEQVSTITEIVVQAVSQNVNKVVLIAAEKDEQQPIAADDPIYIKFGPVQLNPQGPVRVNASGKFTIQDEGRYTFDGIFSLSRTGKKNKTVMFIRMLIDGQPIRDPIAFTLVGDKPVLEGQFSYQHYYLVGAEVEFQFYVDSSGEDDGLLKGVDSTLGWGSSNSALMRVTQL